MSIYSIYKATNKINNKVYIGFDSNWPSRIKQHYNNSLNVNHMNYALYHAIRKHGWNNFEWECILQSKDKDYIYKEMETHFIIEYNSYGNNGYNMTMGGDGNTGYKHTKEEKERQRIRQLKWLEDNGHPLLGKSHSEETKEKIAKGRRLSNHSPFKGRKHSEETKAKMRLSLLNKKKGII